MLKIQRFISFLCNKLAIKENVQTFFWTERGTKLPFNNDLLKFVRGILCYVYNFPEAVTNAFQLRNVRSWCAEMGQSMPEELRTKIPQYMNHSVTVHNSTYVRAEYGQNKSNFTDSLTAALQRGCGKCHRINLNNNHSSSCLWLRLSKTLSAT